MNQFEAGSIRMFGKVPNPDEKKTACQVCGSTTDVRGQAGVLLCAACRKSERDGTGGGY